MIVSAIQKGNSVVLYNERGSQIAVIPFNPRESGDGLKGYTSSTVSIQVCRNITTYDERGSQKFVTTI